MHRRQLNQPQAQHLLNARAVNARTKSRFQLAAMQRRGFGEAVCRQIRKLILYCRILTAEWDNQKVSILNAPLISPARLAIVELV